MKTGQTAQQPGMASVAAAARGQEDGVAQLPRRFGALIIGDEIMRGKRADKHFPHVVATLAARGLRLAWCLTMADDRARLTEVLRQTLASGDVVFSFGGIGVTPDDHTRQAMAAACDAPLELHADAEQEIRAYCETQGQEVSAARLQLGTYPRGSRIVPNPVNRMPGFSWGDHHFYPGFPQMAWPMLEWTLEQYYRASFHQALESEDSIRVWAGSEGHLLPLMQAIEARYPQVTLFSLPTLGTEELRRHIELGLRGEPAQVSAGMQEIRREVSRLGYEWSEMQTSGRVAGEWRESSGRVAGE